MAVFEVLVNGIVVGHSQLDRHDPSMGVAEGRFVPTSAYESIQEQVIASRNAPETHPPIEIRLNGRVIPRVGPAVIVDYSAELGESGLEVEVFGIPHPLYGELFPEA